MAAWMRLTVSKNILSGATKNEATMFHGFDGDAGHGCWPIARKAGEKF